MKRLLLMMIILFNLNVSAQKIKHFDSFIKLSDMSTRYVAVLEDNTIWWYSPDQNWKKSNIDGLPDGFNIKHFSAYSKPDGTSRYVTVLSDNSIWWYAPETLKWTKSSVEGLPSGYSVKFFKAFLKEEGTRYVVVLEDNSIFWYAPDQIWKKSTMDGLPN